MSTHFEPEVPLSYLESLFALNDRVALITGGSSGIGLAMAEALARAGAGVVLVARREEALAETAARLRAEGCKAAHVAADLEDRAQLEACCEKARVPFGAPDILVCAAAINLRPPLTSLTDPEWDRTLRLNLDAPFLLAQRLAPAMIERRWGRIINVASQQSVRAFGNSGAYGASKAGLTGLTRSQAEAWSKHGVCCNAIAPGFVRTPLTEPVFSDPARAQAMADRTMIGRNGVPDDLCGIAVFLSSRASDFVTGQTIFVDGGFSVH